jgi:hypothetical protein
MFTTPIGIFVVLVAIGVIVGLVMNRLAVAGPLGEQLPRAELRPSAALRRCEAARRISRCAQALAI